MLLKVAATLIRKENREKNTRKCGSKGRHNSRRDLEEMQ
jgi:hypothetical protein